ncbi:hypothetical protein PSPTOT1_4807 [Pseudomonas syringae pv. tomato T1]|nr:hypothetical protein PSPTOT1_4807 [Pseudomonas syringae pv. tomato T1]
MSEIGRNLPGDDRLSGCEMLPYVTGNAYHLFACKKLHSVRFASHSNALKQVVDSHLSATLV